MMQIIAMVTMLLDHLGIAFFKDQIGWRIVGRLAFPFYAYGIVQGYLYTRSFERYYRRLLILAVVSQLPFMLALNTWNINVIGTFLVCLSVLMLLDRVRSRWTSLLIVAVSAFFLDVIPFDYGSYALLLILVYRYLQRWISAHFVINLLFIFYKGWFIEMVSIISTVFIFYSPGIYNLLNKVRFPRWVWRSFYPVHLTIITFFVFLNHQ